MKLINYISVFLVFAGAFVFRDVSLGVIEIDFYLSYAWILPLLLVFILYSQSKLHKEYVTVLLFLLSLFVIGVVNVIIGNSTFIFLLKQLIGIVLMSSFFYFLLRYNNFDFSRLFSVYMNLSLVVAAIGFLQVFGYLLSIRPLYDFSYIIPDYPLYIDDGGLRAHSILPEPSVYAMTMAPALFISTFNIFKSTSHFINRTASYFILVSFFLTFSSIAYITVILSCVLLYKNPFSLKKVLISLVFLATSVLILYSTVDMVTSRVDGIIELFINNNVNSSVNVSAFALFNNYTVATQNFIHHPLFGTGLGSHQIAFDTYAYLDVFGGNSKAEEINTLNREDANSLFLRVLSEMGLFGVFIVGFFIWRYRVKKDSYGSLEWIISTSILVLFIVKMIRSGHYFNAGSLFFPWIYYYAGRFKQANKSES